MLNKHAFCCARHEQLITVNITGQLAKGGPNAFRWRRLASKAAFGGLLDGNLEHAWYLGLDGVITGHGPLDAVAKAVCDSSLYTPAYCVLFLGISTLLEGGGLTAATARIKQDFKPMALGTIATWCVTFVYCDSPPILGAEYTIHVLLH